MSTIHLNRTTTATPEQFVAGLTDFGPDRSKLFDNSQPAHLEMHDHGASYADVTEGTGSVWERLHYDWSNPHRVIVTDTDSNVWGGASGYTYTLTELPEGTTDVDVVVVREGKNLKGRLIAIVLGTVGRGRLTKSFGKTVQAIEARNRGEIGLVSAGTSSATLIEPQFRTIDGLRIRCAEGGGGEPVVLLTSPWPESLYAFAPMWATLAEHGRLLAVDLPGFGASERRDELLSPSAMGGFLAQLIDEADLGRPHIVAPDVGTSAALFAAAAHPERIASVIVGTGGAAVPLELGEPLASWVLDPDLDKYRNMDSRAIVDAAVNTIAGGVPDDIHADYVACYDGDRFVESMRYVRRYPEELPALAELLPHITTPVTIINGRNDRVVPLANAEFLDVRLPTSRLVIIDAGHFIWEEEPAQYASIIIDSITNWV